MARLIPLLDRFAGEISACRLMELTQPWWQYEITVRETEITLSLVPTEVLYDRGRSWGEKNRPFLLPVQEAFPILTAKAALLSPEDFGKLYGVSGGTVRQWIRRGKIRSASKFGREWRIPELTIVPNWEHYIDGNYLWHQELPDVPEEFSCLNAYRQIALSSVKGKKDLWHVSLSDGVKEDAETASFDLDTKKRLHAVSGEIVHHLMEAENSLVHFHDLIRETGIHRSSIHMISHVVDHVIESIQRRAYRNGGQILRRQNVSEDLKVFI